MGYVVTSEGEVMSSFRLLLGTLYAHDNRWEFLCTNGTCVWVQSPQERLEISGRRLSDQAGGVLAIDRRRVMAACYSNIIYTKYVWWIKFYQPIQQQTEESQSTFYICNILSASCPLELPLSVQKTKMIMTA
jgi:hypothetical protein